MSTSKVGKKLRRRRLTKCFAVCCFSLSAIAIFNRSL